MQTNNKLRKALETLVDVVDAWKDHLPPVIRVGELAKAIKKAEAALAEPVKNCEVGTAEAQWRRFRKYCGCRCLTKCKVYEKGIALGIVNDNNYYKTDCRFVWAQMPYEAQEGGAK